MLCCIIFVKLLCIVFSFTQNGVVCCYVSLDVNCYVIKIYSILEVVSIGIGVADVYQVDII